MNNKKTIIILVLAVVAVGGIGFFSGTVYQKKIAKIDSPFGNNKDRGQQMGFAGGATGNRAAGGGMTIGEILSIDGQTMTIKLPDGGSKIILFTDTTPVTKTISADKTEVKVGENVTVSGKSNQDGSLTANSIQIRPTAGIMKPADKNN
ncbi:MAG: DUF5666 domain-containing protein [Candidatus Colwellbacteria bacterium]|nr:DUF5666 domain-containing protein [Candidatus Colwellbacteria bacterium]